MFRCKNEQPSFGFGTLGAAGGPRGVFGTPLDFLGVTWGSPGACQGCFGEPEGPFFITSMFT